MSLDVEGDFGQALGRFEKLVELETGDSGQGVEWAASWCERDDVVRLRIDPEFGRIKILEHIVVAQFGDVDDAVRSSVKFGVILVAKRDNGSSGVPGAGIEVRLRSGF